MAIFEESLERVEKIVESLEFGTTTLDESMELFNEGIKLSNECKEMLEKAEFQVQKLIEKEGVVELENIGGGE